MREAHFYLSQAPHTGLPQRPYSQATYTPSPASPRLSGTNIPCSLMPGCEQAGCGGYEFFLGYLLKDEVLKIMPVQKQKRAGTRFKAFVVAIGDDNDHVGLKVKCSEEVALTICGAIILVKVSIVPVRRGYWGNKPHPMPYNVTGRCGSILVCLSPAPCSTGIVSAPVPKKLMMMTGIDDCYTSARGCNANFAKMSNFAKATFDAVSKTYSYLSPDLWKEMVVTKSPCQEFTDHLVKTHTTRVSVQRTQAADVAT
ncbi:40S ribosomal protein S2-like [Thamnophis elegans]|uniref:40S ribosomal protein S2-like n=1 Tax=Thamnophis elegans TaxID=35005 RepID=UPI001376B16D|nr:40S ribosomal protein S2-like [Thamnophis elegans]